MRVILATHGNSSTQSYLVPDWANWAARDESGKLWVYEVEPVQSPQSSDYALGFWFPNVGGGNIKEIENPVKGRKLACPRWRETLVRLRNGK